jgi:hypothetical protein
MQTVTVSFSEDKMAEVNQAAQKLDLTPEGLLKASVEEKLQVLMDSRFEAAAAHVLKKNAELYRRLA